MHRCMCLSAPVLVILPSLPSYHLPTRILLRKARASLGPALAVKGDDHYEEGEV
jgi:hypothetical protein